MVSINPSLPSASSGVASTQCRGALVANEAFAFALVIWCTTSALVSCAPSVVREVLG